MREIELIKIAAEELFNSGWEIEINSARGGIQSDIYAEKASEVPLLIECKAFERKVGLRTAQEFIGVVSFLRESNKDLQAYMVTTSGYTKKASDALISQRITPFTLNEFKAQLNSGKQASSQPFDWEKSLEKHSDVKTAFVIMPFKEEMLDVFLLGIRSVAEELNFVANRADDLEHNGEIIDEIKDAIRNADFVIADTTGGNANVCYEVGFAHALEKPTVLLCRKGESLPFDLKGANHIMYPNVVGVRSMLKEKLTNMLNN